MTTSLSQSVPVFALDHERPQLVERAERAVADARAYAMRVQRPDGHWCAELESNATITAEYVFMRQALGLDLRTHRDGLVRYFFGQQKPDGSWGLATNHRRRRIDHGRDVPCAAHSRRRASTTRACRAPSATFSRTAGSRRSASSPASSSRCSASSRGARSLRCLRSSFSCRRRAPVNVYALSSWARGTIVPLLILLHRKPLFALPNGKSPENDWLDHLWLDPARKEIPYSEPLARVLRETGASWTAFFTAVDSFLGAYEGEVRRVDGPLGKLRRHALRRCEEWMRRAPGEQW